MKLEARIFRVLLQSTATTLLLLVAAAQGAASSPVLHVPRDYATIQAAIDAASPGDRVLIAKGTFKGPGNVNLNPRGKAITIEGAGYLNTIIECAGRARGFVFAGGETSKTEVRSLSIQNGFAELGGAILIQNSSPAIFYCSVEDGKGKAGGGVWVQGGSPGFVGCRFERNVAGVSGGAIFAEAASITVAGCSFISNSSHGNGGAMSLNEGHASIFSTAFQDNRADSEGGALSGRKTEAQIVNGSFSANAAGSSGGALQLSDGSKASISYSTFAANISRSPSGALFADETSGATVDNSVLWANGPMEAQGSFQFQFSCVKGGAAGQGNTSEDPKLVDATSHDLRLGIGSPCIDMAQAANSVTDTDQDGRPRIIGSSSDMGAFEFPITAPSPLLASYDNIFQVPHDGNPVTDTVGVTIVPSGYDWLLGSISYLWMLDAKVVGISQELKLTLSPGLWIFGLQVRNDSGTFSTTKIPVQVLPEKNVAPVAYAGPDRSVICKGGTVVVSLKGHAYDADGDPLTYRWSDATGTTSPDCTVELTPGYYVFTLTAADPYGERDESTVRIHVMDGVGPVIDLNGPNPLAHEVFALWSDPGATAHDAVDGSNLAIKVTGVVDTHKLGSYELVYRAVDNSGNEGSVTRTVQVLDRTPPVIALAGMNPLSLDCLKTFTEPGASAIDNYDGPVAVTSQGSVTSSPGTYQITYTASDSSGNVATAVRTVVVADTSPPVIHLLGANPLNIECGAGYIEPGATATDGCDGSEVSISITGKVPGVKGTYAVTYTATDSAGNTSTRVRTVNVVDTAAPILSLLGSNPMTVDCMTGYTEPGASSLDSCEGALPVVITGDVGSVSGTYSVVYTATDSSGNKATAVRTVYVVSKTPPSANTFNATPGSLGPTGGMRSIKLHYGFASHCSAFTWKVTCSSSDPDSGAFPGDVPGDIVKVDEYNFKVRAEAMPGKKRTYTFTLTAKDAEGNVASRQTTVVVG